MSVKNLLSKTANVVARPVERKEDHEIRTAPVRTYDITRRMHEAEQKVTELETKLKEAQASSNRDIALNQLIEAPGRKRKLSEDEFSDLVENLRNNPLVAPITVRPVAEDKYEIVSGHNRAEAFRKLGRSSIPAVIMAAEDVQADLNAFYANLLQPSLPDYEKYLGFCMIKNHRPDFTQEQIADMAGISRQQVSRLMAFASLPFQAVSLLEKNPRVLGANAAAELAVFVKAGKADQVTRAIERLVAGEIDQTTALKESARLAHEEESPVKTKLEPRAIKQGKATYCSIRRAEKTIRIDFKTLEAAETAEKAIHQLLDMLAKQAKGDE